MHTAIFFLLLCQEEPVWQLEQTMADPVWLGKLPVQLAVTPHGTVLSVQSEVGRPEERLLLRQGSWKEIAVEQRETAEGVAHPLAAGRLLWEIRGRLFLQDGSAFRPLLATSQKASVLRIQKDGRVVLRLGDNLALLDLKAFQLRLLTDLRFEDEPKDVEGWPAREEPVLLEYVKHRLRIEEEGKARERESQLADPGFGPRPTRMGKGFKLASEGFDEDVLHFLYPDEQLKQAVAVLVDTAEEPATTFAEHINLEGQVKARTARARVGHASSTWRAFLLDLSAGTTHSIDLSTLPGLDQDPLAAVREEQRPEDKPFLSPFASPRPVSIYPGGFEGSMLLLTVIAQDFKDRWICLYDVQKKALQLVHRHSDSAWLQYYLSQAGLGPSVSARAFWVDEEHIAFLSDENGLQQLYLHDRSKQLTRNITPFSGEIYSPFLSADRRHWYFHGNLQHPGTRHFYRMERLGGAAEMLTEGQGHHSVLVDEISGVLWDLHGHSTRPAVLRRKEPGKNWALSYDGCSARFKSLPTVEPELITYPASDGQSVHARLYRPQQANGAAVVFIHGAGYLQNAHSGWSSYFREFFFHQLLLQEGFTILDPDYRGSAGYGRSWRTGIYRHMGGRDLEDVVDGASFLASQGIDPARIAVYGGSYGGFLTLMALFTRPDTFAAGAALRPVTDWAYYNHWYTSRILNTPQVDPLGYRRSSPIYFAEGLKGRLLLCHGMVDDNVHFQDSVRLAQRLVELGKTNWELAAYPVEAHGFRMPSSWRDEYRRIHELVRESLLP
jgi:acetyl esterase/lipase